MAKSISVKPKRRGRPPSGGRDPLVGLRLPPQKIAALDALAADWGVTRSEVIRQIVHKALSDTTPPKPERRPGAGAKAKRSGKKGG